MVIKNIIDPQYQSHDYFPIDLSVQNKFWDLNDVSDITVMDKFLEDQRLETGKFVAHGGYREQRALYRKSARFQTGAVRDVHMGVDLWVPAGTGVHALMDGTIHSFTDNDDAGNYGPTLILEHEYEEDKLYSLYGHLSRSDMQIGSWESAFAKANSQPPIGLSDRERWMYRLYRLSSSNSDFRFKVGQ